MELGHPLQAGKDCRWVGGVDLELRRDQWVPVTPALPSAKSLRYLLDCLYSQWTFGEILKIPEIWNPPPAPVHGGGSSENTASSLRASEHLLGSASSLLPSLPSMSCELSAVAEDREWAGGAQSLWGSVAPSGNDIKVCAFTPPGPRPMKRVKHLLMYQFHSFFKFAFIFSWQITALQCCVGFCHTET